MPKIVYDIVSKRPARMPERRISLPRRLPGKAILQAKVRSLRLRRFGAVGDGITNDAPAFNRALERAASRSSNLVYVPPGTYRISSSIHVPPGVALVGEPASPWPHDATKASILLAAVGEGKEEGDPLITLDTYSRLQNFTIYYPWQHADRIVPYPWTIRAEGTGVGILDIHISNAYQAIDLATCHTVRHHVQNIRGQPLYRGLCIDRYSEMGKIENVHFRPLWQESQSVLRFMRKKAIAFEIGQSDWEYMSNCHASGYATGFRFGASEGGPSNALLTQCSAEDCVISAHIEHVSEPAGVSFVNTHFGSRVEIGPGSTGPVRFSDCSFKAGTDSPSLAVLQGRSSTTFTSCHFSDWDLARGGHPAISLERGSLTISDCQFWDAGKKQVAAGPDATSMAIFSNQLRGREHLEVAPGVDSQIGLNTVVNGEPSA